VCLDSPRLVCFYCPCYQYA